ncbi:MAG: RsmB/NOP family class I SAM-dependent RNA methyltransferase [Bacillales bacterium]|nr:RsmB/NOP family class I SAM-dependent RNA methyltransferase [Bacillales bacterium]
MKVSSIGEAIKRMPQYLYDQIMEQYDHNVVDRIIKGYMEKRVTSLRVNNLKKNQIQIINELKEEGIKIDRVSFSDDVLIIKNANLKTLQSLKMYDEGSIYLQSLSSCLPPIILNPKKNVSILDMAAAPGGKTTELASLTNNESSILACEVNQIRCERLKYNVAKQGATSVEVRNIDSRKLEDGLSFDYILLDAPCSGTGTIDLNDKQTYVSFSPRLVEKSSRTQLVLLKKALHLLKDGGTMVYSTCSILKQENEDIILEALKEFPNVSIVPIMFKGMELLPTLPTKIKGALTVMPSILYEGFFICKLKKKGSK